MKNGKKVVVGTQDGVVELFSWGNWGDCTDRIPGHPSSVDAIAKVDDDTICTGGGDGIIRMISVLPNRVLRVVGSLSGFPVESLEVRWIVSVFNARLIEMDY
jgi:WD repeat-containing protein 55